MSLSLGKASVHTMFLTGSINENQICITTSHLLMEIVISEMISTLGRLCYCTCSVVVSSCERDTCSCDSAIPRLLNVA